MWKHEKSLHLVVWWGTLCSTASLVTWLRIVQCKVSEHSSRNHLTRRWQFWWETVLWSCCCSCGGKSTTELGRYSHMLLPVNGMHKVCWLSANQRTVKVLNVWLLVKAGNIFITVHSSLSKCMYQACNKLAGTCKLRCKENTRVGFKLCTIRNPNCFHGFQ